MLTGGAGLRAMTLAFEEVFALRDVMGDVPMAGRTDSWIFSQVAERHAVPSDTATRLRFHDAYIAHLAREIHLPGPRKGMMPGVGQLLDALEPREDVYLALLTGNFESGARIKLEYFDLWRYFACGAFGDHLLERNALLPIALEQVRAAGGPDFHPTDIVVIGDTPLDVAVAIAAGARSIAVATGSHDIPSLSHCGADVVLSDLGDVRAVLEAIGVG